MTTLKKILASFGDIAHRWVMGFMHQVGALQYAVVTLKSTVIANADATPVVMNSAHNDKGVLRQSQGFAVIANGDSIASIYRVCRLRSSDRISVVKLYCPAIATAIADIGLYDTAQNGGAVVDVDFLASAQTLVAALNGVDVTFEAAAAGGLITNAEKRIWEALGLTADPMKDYDLALTLTAAATAAGTALVRAEYVSGN